LRSAYALGWPGVESVAKPAAMALLIVSFAMRDGRADIKRLVTAALVASLAGDTLLLSPSLFAPGLFAFLVAHGFYIAAFSRGVGFLPSRIAAVAIGAFAALVFAYVWPGVASRRFRHPASRARRPTSTRSAATTRPPGEPRRSSSLRRSSL